ncbi:spore germination protein KA [Melghirimyces thermohalophilus]|uniref:Spore germination protein KA n=1 Tax=Melghirimyces thermohalophilus TaxID=1236220 RepID=A0A1G6KQ00_9BACL|nr:spore germination protein [Melghirimyces thermohalophilus]SDC32898.1 spore germination protein KA [Melghirimyces thermohalophilus]
MSYKRLMNRLFKRRNQAKQQETDIDLIPIYKRLDDNLAFLKKTFGNSMDLAIYHAQIGKPSVKLAVIYLESMVEDQSINRLMTDIYNQDNGEGFTSKEHTFDWLKEKVVSVGEAERLSNLDDICSKVTYGHVVVLMDGVTHAISGDTSAPPHRSISEPTTQRVTQGPKEGFTEDIATNLSLVRRRIPSTNLRFDEMKVGRITRTRVAVTYVDGIVNPQLVAGVKRRLQNINTDSVLDTRDIGDWIEDNKFSVFQTMLYYERPDTVAAKILEGRVAILVEGTPFVLILPVTALETVQAPEDYYLRYDIATFLRAIRFIAFFLALLSPSIYVALATFHQDMLPTDIALNIVSQREGVPFPIFVEALLMELTFEVLREAGVRAPRILGVSITIVGAVIIGQTAVDAGVVTPIKVIIVSVTGIASFVAPEFSISVSARLLRFAFLILASTYGFFGIGIAFIIMVFHVQSLRSFGVPYLAPLSPFIGSDLKDVIFRVPHWAMTKRPAYLQSMMPRRIRFQTSQGKVRYDD